MQLQFLVDSVQRDLKLLDFAFGDDGQKRVSLKDVQTVLNRWEKALEDEKILKEKEQRFQDILNKKGALTPSESQEAVELIVFIHKPLIRGFNDFMGVRLKDADFLRFHNKLIGLPLEHGIADLNRKIEEYDKAEQKKKADKKAKRKAAEQFATEYM